jgi:alkylation response protein AidB-like acyl-CoA dehydrogenase
MNDETRQQKILENAREFAESEIKPVASVLDKTGVLPKELIKKLADKGFLAATFPEKYGGLALDPVYYGLFTEEIGKACCSTRSLITVHTSLVGETLLRWGSESQKELWIPLMVAGKKIGAFALSEPAVGSDAQSVQTSYRKKGNNFLISGKKKWITFGDVADFFIVIASGEKKITAFLIERAFSGVRTKPIEGMLANRASHIAEIEFHEVVVPPENVIGTEGNGFSYVTNTALDHGRYSIAWAGVAVAQAALEAMISYTRERKQFGQKIYRFQLIQGIIGDAVTKIHAARAFCLRAGEMRKAAHKEAITETAMAKYFSSRMAMEVTIDAVQVHGGEGCSSSYPVERLFREAKVLEIIEGTSQIQQQLIAQYSLRKYYKRPKKGHE